MLNVQIEDNDLTASFDAKLRKTSLETLLADCLRARTRAEPLVVVLEDCHWLDPLSRDLLQVLARVLPGLKCLFVVAYRPEKEPGGGLGLAKLKHFQEVALTELDPSQAAKRRAPGTRGTDHEARPRQSFLHTGADQLHPQPGRRSRGHDPLEGSAAARQPA